MKAFLVALLLLLSTTCFANPPTQPPPFVPNAPAAPSTAKGPSPDDLLHLLLGDDAEDKTPAPEIKCDTHPCVPAYRFSDHVDGDTVGKFQKFMEAATAAKPDYILIELNTPGGSMDEGHEMSRTIESTPVPVVCVVDGTSASMGMYILASCDVRVMTKRSQLMIHQVHLMAPNGAVITDVNNANSSAVIQVATRAYIEWVVHRFKTVTVDQTLQKISNGHEWWLNWSEAIGVGAVDEVIDTNPSKYLNQLKKTGKP